MAIPKKARRPKGMIKPPAPPDPFPPGCDPTAIATLRITCARGNTKAIEMLNQAAKGDQNALKLLGMALKYNAWVFELQSVRKPDFADGHPFDPEDF